MLLLEYPVYNFSMVGTEIQHATLWGGGGGICFFNSKITC